MGNTKSIYYQGEKLSLKKLAKLNGICERTLRRKYKLTQDINQAVVNAKDVKHEGQKQTAKTFGINYATLVSEMDFYELKMDEVVSVHANKSKFLNYKFDQDTSSIHKLKKIDCSTFQPNGFKTNDHTLLNNTVDAIEVAENKVLNDELKKRVTLAMKRLIKQEQEVINLRYGLEDGFSRTMEEVGHILGVTREYVRQVENRAFCKLYNYEKNTHTSAETGLQIPESKTSMLDIYELLS